MSPGAGVAIYEGAFACPPLQPQPGEDHRLVRAGPESLPDGKKKHGRKEYGQVPGECKNEEAGDVGAERDDHGAPPSPQVGDGARGDLEDVDGDFAECDEQTNLEEAETFFEKDEDQEGFEVALVLQQAVQTEAEEHG